MIDNAENLILEHLEAIHASQTRMEEKLRDIESRLVSSGEEHKYPLVPQQPDRKKSFTYKGYQVRPGRYVRSEGRVEVYQGVEGEEPEYEDVITVVSTPGEARRFVDAMVGHVEAHRQADQELQKNILRLEKEAGYKSFRFGTEESDDPLADDDEESNPIAFKPFTYRGHHVRPGRHVSSRGRVEMYVGAKNRRLGTKDIIHVVDTPHDARELIQTFIIYAKAELRAREGVYEVVTKFNAESYFDWFHFGTDEAGGLCAGDDEWVGDGTHPPT